MKGMSLSTGRLVLFALLGAILVGLQVAMAALPNVEAVSLLVMVYTVVFGGAVAYILCVFVVLEMLIWGAGTWVISYLYVWAVLAVLAWALRKMDSGLGHPVRRLWPGLWGAVCAGLSACGRVPDVRRHLGGRDSLRRAALCQQFCHRLFPVCALSEASGAALGTSGSVKYVCARKETPCKAGGRGISRGPLCFLSPWRRIYFAQNPT